MSIRPGAIFELSIPLPPSGCTAQQGRNRFVRQSATKKHRGEAYLVALKFVRDFPNMFPCQHVVSIEQEWHVVRGHGRYAPTDPQNMIASLKAAIDGFVDAGLLVNDTYKYVQWGQATRLSKMGEHCGVAQVRLIFRVSSTPVPAKKVK